LDPENLVGPGIQSALDRDLDFGEPDQLLAICSVIVK
jgi:hypothetical protein